MSSLACPTCSLALDVVPTAGDSAFVCREQHRYTVEGLALTTNIGALKALWQAIRALEDDAASLRFMAERYGDRFGMPAERRRQEAEHAEHTAGVLREHARRAQQRLDALPVSGAVVPGRTRGRRSRTTRAEAGASPGRLAGGAASYVRVG